MFRAPGSHVGRQLCIIPGHAAHAQSRAGALRTWREYPLRMKSLDVIPTAQDLRDAAAQEAIAVRQQAAYDQVLLWVMGKFGVGWVLSGRHFLLDKLVEDEARKTGTRPAPASTCYSAERRSAYSALNKVRKDGLFHSAWGSEGTPSMRLRASASFWNSASSSGWCWDR